MVMQGVTISDNTVIGTERLRSSPRGRSDRPAGAENHQKQTDTRESILKKRKSARNGALSSTAL